MAKKAKSSYRNHGMPVNRVQASCEWCGSTFISGGVRNAQFCSNECRRRAEANPDSTLHQIEK
jgi:hypothetical protein